MLLPLVLFFALARASRAALPDPNLQPLPDSIGIGEGNTLFLTWRGTTSPLTKCWVKTPQGKLFPLDKQGDKNERISYHGLGLDKGYCGAKIKQIKSSDKGNWTLQGEGVHDIEQFSNTTNISVLGKPLPQKRIITGTTGYVVKVPCGSNKSIYCIVTSPTGEKTEVNGECTVSITANKVAEGKWTCIYGMPGFSEAFEDTTTLYVIEEKPMSMLGYKETSSSVNIYCNTKTTPSYNRFCHLVSPSGSHLFVTRERAIGRYTYYGKNSTQCGISIPKPLQDDEYGSWLCHFQVDNMRCIGGYVIVPKHGSNTTSSLKPTTEYPIVYGQDGSSVTIKCHINASIDYCWIMSPNGTTFAVSENGVDGRVRYSGKGFTFGDCGISLSPLNKNDTGKWTCGIGTTALGIWDVSETISLVVTGTPVAVDYLVTETSKGSAASLSCSSLSKSSLSYCRFVRPDGVGFHVGSETQPSQYSYRGKGLAYGECNLHIASVQDHDFGKWTCAFQEVASFGKQIAVTLELRQSEGFSWIWICGIVIVSLLVFGVFGFVIGKRYVIPKLRGRLSTSETELYNARDNVSCISDSNGAAVIHPSSNITQRNFSRRNNNAFA